MKVEVPVISRELYLTMGSSERKSRSSSRKRSYSSSSSDSKYRSKYNKYKDQRRSSVRSSSSSSNWSSSPSPERSPHREYSKKHKSKHKKHKYKKEEYRRSSSLSPHSRKQKKKHKSNHKRSSKSSSKEKDHSEKRYKDKRKSFSIIKSNTESDKYEKQGVHDPINETKVETREKLYISKEKIQEDDSLKYSKSNVVSNLISTKKIEIKITSSTGKDSKPQSASENKTDLFGKWEPVERKGLKELTELCKKLSKETAEEEIEPRKTGSKETCQKEPLVLHHPYKLPPPPPLPIINAAPVIPMNPAQAIQAGMIRQVVGNIGMNPTLPKEIQAAFPVSSGLQHRTKENASEGLPNAPVFERPNKPVNISSVIANRLQAQNAINANPFDIEAIAKLKECDEMIKQWSTSNVQPEQFTGEKTKNILSKDELGGGYSAWVRKDFFNNLQPIRDGIGLRLLQKMGWTYGQPLGKNRAGFVNPLFFEIRTDRRGLTTAEDNVQTLKAKRKGPPVVDVKGKHPVSALSEICTKRKWPMPDYKLVMDSGPSHRKSYLFKAIVNGEEFTATSPSPNKKNAKAQAATAVLDKLGLLS
ncbi:protein SON-like isoform X2 [Rhopilema esculentum]|uniref:protein SON-like isoform X2 n=1 Tax=Rhopilema esculentum TaxID=499914 RepID=UPI0031CF5CF1